MAQNWTSLSENATATEAASNKSYSDLKPLIVYLEKETIDIPVGEIKHPCKNIISKDVEKLMTLAKKIKTEVSDFERMLTKGQIPEMLAKEADYLQMKK